MVNVPASVPLSAGVAVSDTSAEPAGALPRLHEQAGQCAAALAVAMDAVVGAPYHSELARLRERLHARDIEGALNAWRCIPWVFENEFGYGGLALYEQRDASIKKAARALDTVLGQMKVYVRYGWFPQSAPHDETSGLVLF